jgi:hypothetical protein
VIRRARMIGFLVMCVVLLLPVAAWADFGIKPGSMKTSFEVSEKTGFEVSEGVAGLPQASSHPYAFNLSFALNADSQGRSEGGEVRDVLIDLPPGMIGNPTAVPRCTRQEFDGFTPNCSPNSQVGVIHADIPGLGFAAGPIYNVVPPPGVAGQLGFSVDGLNALQYVSLRNGSEGYGLHVTTNNIPLEVTEVEATIWGTPGDESHDALRGKNAFSGFETGSRFQGPILPFFTLPADCEKPLETTVSVDSKLDPGHFVSATAYSVNSGGEPAALLGCGAVPFNPGVSLAPTVSRTDSNSGLDFDLKFPNDGLTNPEPGTVVETEPVKTVVTLPAGVAVNPSAAAGQAACPLSSFEPTGGGTPSCPSASKIGTLLAHSPLLEEPIEGGVYLAEQGHNPFGSLVAIYFIARAPIRGVTIAQAGKVDIDPSTGQLAATFDGLPPVPYSDLALDLREGPHGVLTTPSGCGTYTAQAKFYPFSDPDTATVRSIPFKVTAGAGGGACPAGEGALANAPAFGAGTDTPVAGAFAPFVFKVSREDGSQRLGAIDTTLPEGLLGRLAGVPFCSDAQIAAASARSGEGQGALEQSSPSCPESSQVGVVDITAGAGPDPYPVQGRVYLAGPYKNAPLSLAIITPAIAGPFDLGAVVVRVGLYIDPNTAQITAISDPLPTILDGIPLDIRSVSLDMNRAGFTFNPTSCEPLSVTGQAISTLNQTVGLSDRFQVGGCAGLPFKPAMIISTQGKTSKANGASLTVTVSQKPGEADIHKVDLTLPSVLPARLTTLQQACTEAQFNTNPAGCPPGSFIGTAKAITPILNVPLTGPAILVSHGGAAFPDVVFLLQANERGADIRVDLDGKTDIKKGVTYSRFETVPDAPISSFETDLPQGPHSVLSADGNLCAGKLAIPTELTGQNGALVKQNTPVTVTGCPKAKVLTRAQKLALALKACHKKPKGSKRTRCERAARKKYGPLKKAKRSRSRR